MKTGKLYICPTPLGNLEDITLRVLRILQEVSLIAAEDTRHTRKLLNHFSIRTKLTSYYEHNKTKKKSILMDFLLNGQDIALVSDAGMPGISDPGEELVCAAVELRIPVVPLPGPTALITALVASGLPAAPFAFYGFPPARGAARREFLNKLIFEEKTLVFYEAPHRLIKTLTELANASADRKVVVAREMTKIHEEFVRGTLHDVLTHFREVNPRGECTVILTSANNNIEIDLSPLELVNKFQSSGMTKKDAIRETAKCLSLPRNEIYRLLLENKE